MANAYVLMTALPPTKGHLDLIKFANDLDVDLVKVILCVLPDEPMKVQRLNALSRATAEMDRVEILYREGENPQDPSEHEDFWNYWAEFLRREGFRAGDYIVSSEAYGVPLAAATEGVYMPYDPDRTIRYTKASLLREDYRLNWDGILPEFRPYLRKTVTLFGAESVGKTSTAKFLAPSLGNSKWYPEWARPYLEATGPEITEEKMMRIWEGQRALQRSALLDKDVEFRVQDTDLFSTLGYWEMWSPDTVPNGLRQDAQWYRSDVYFILGSNIPFEKDPLRLGGDHRETDDQYWIDLCERENLPYHYVTTENLYQRVFDIEDILEEMFPGDELRYQRRGAEYDPER